MPEERRVVTVLFADVTGSTALGESSDPEDVRALLGRYNAIAREVIGAHGGTLELHSKPGEGTRFTLLFPSTASAALSATMRS